MILSTRGLSLKRANTRRLKTQIPGELDRSVETVKDGIYDTRAVISEGGKTYGWVEVGFSINPILAVIANAQQWSITIASLEMILVALFSLALGRYLTNKLFNAS